MIIIPTLNRPEQCAQVVKRVVSCGDTVLVFINAPHRLYEEAFEAAGLFGVHSNLMFHADGTNHGCLGALNKTLKMFPFEGSYTFIADDEFLDPHSAPNWHEQLCNAAGAWDFSHGIDSIWNGVRAQGFLCIGGSLARAVGYLAVPTCWHWYGVDDMFETLARVGACGNVIVPSVRVDHRHFSIGKAERDECYKLGASKILEDKAAFQKWTDEELPRVIERIRQAKNAG